MTVDQNSSWGLINIFNSRNCAIACRDTSMKGAILLLGLPQIKKSAIPEIRFDYSIPLVLQGCYLREREEDDSAKGRRN